MALQPAWRSLGYLVGNADKPTQPEPFYRFYLLQADDHIARRRMTISPMTRRRSRLQIMSSVTFLAWKYGAGRARSSPSRASRRRDGRRTDRRLG